MYCIYSKAPSCPLLYTRSNCVKQCCRKAHGVWIFNEPHPLPQPNLHTSMRIQWRRKRKVGHVCRFNEAKKRCKLMFSSSLFKRHTTLSSDLLRQRSVLLTPFWTSPFSPQMWVLVVLNSRIGGYRVPCRHDHSWSILIPPNFYFRCLLTHN